MLARIISAITGILVSIFGSKTNMFEFFGPVETSEQAQLIGEQVAHEVFPNVNYNNYRIRVSDDRPFLIKRVSGDIPDLTGGVWCVSYYLIDSNEEPALVFGGGGPEIHIRKTDGKIISCSLQR